MYSALHKNKWPLLAFLVITLAGLQLFIGEGSGFAPHEPAKLAPPAFEAAPPAPEPEALATENPDLEGFYSDTDSEESYVDDQELIDSAEGYDPTPAVESEESVDDGVVDDFASDQEYDSSAEAGF